MIIDKVTEYPKTEDEFPGLFTVNFKPDPFLCLGDKSDYLGWLSKMFSKSFKSLLSIWFWRPWKFSKLIGKIERQFRFAICRMEISSELISVKNIHLTCSILVVMLYLQHSRMKMNIGRGLRGLPVYVETTSGLIWVYFRSKPNSEIKLLTFKNQAQYEEKLCFSAIKRNSHKVEILELGWFSKCSKVHNAQCITGSTVRYIAY